MSIGKLIYICGIDGSGKTTLAKNLSNHFGDKSIFLPLNNSKDSLMKLIVSVKSIIQTGGVYFQNILGEIFGR